MTRKIELLVLQWLNKWSRWTIRVIKVHNGQKSWLIVFKCAKKWRIGIQKLPQKLNWMAAWWQHCICHIISYLQYKGKLCNIKIIKIWMLYFEQWNSLHLHILIEVSFSTYRACPFSSSLRRWCEMSWKPTEETNFNWQGKYHYLLNIQTILNAHTVYNIQVHTWEHILLQSIW